MKTEKQIKRKIKEFNRKKNDLIYDQFTAGDYESYEAVICWLKWVLKNG